jgi:hypothetical protein
MKLTQFETEVLQYLLQNRLEQSEWQALVNNYQITNYDFTGAGYFLDIVCSSIKFEKETIDCPIVIGTVNDLEVGFLLFVEENNITIECHGWSDENLPENIRNLEVSITIDEKRFFS